MDDLASLDDEYNKALKDFHKRLGDAFTFVIEEYNKDQEELVKALKEAGLDDPWFWPNDEQPSPKPERNDLDPFWR